MENSTNVKGSKKELKLFLRVLAVIVGILVILGLVFHTAVYTVFWNLAAEQLDLDETDSSWENGTAYLNVAYSSVSESDYVDLYVPSDVENPPLFVLVHGGGFIANDSQSRQAQLMYRYFRDRGYACASVNYRLAQEAAFPAAVEDVKAAIRFLRANADTYGYDAERIAIWGESAGGYLASAAALTNDDEFCDLAYIGEDSVAEDVSAEVQVLVDFYGLVELEERESDWEELEIPLLIYQIGSSWLDQSVLDGYENISDFWLRADLSELSDEEKQTSDLSYYISENLTGGSDFAVYISHGTCDITVPILQSERFFEKLSVALGEDKVTLHTLERAGHASDSLYTDEELEQVKAFLDANLSR